MKPIIDTNKRYNIIVSNRGYGKKFMCIESIIDKFIMFVDQHSTAIDENYDKTYTINDLCLYVSPFVKELLTDNK